MSWTLCLSGAAVAKAGAYVNDWFVTTISGQAVADAYSDEVESTICLKTRKDWITDYASVKTNFKPVLADVCSDLIAIKMVNYDQSGYLKGEAQTMLDVLKDNADNIIKDLREKEYQEVME